VFEFRREGAGMKKPRPDPATLAALTPDPANRRAHNEHNLALIAEALKDVGAARSIVVDEANVILAGNGVVQAAKGVGLTKLRVVEAAGDELVAVRRSGLTDAQKRALALYDNRTAELATWNVEQLLADQQAGLDLASFWTDDELAALLNANGAPKTGLTDPDDVPEVRATDIQRGDLFELGRHRLLCGDSTVAADVARVMGEERAGLVLTDPPYGMDLDTDWSNAKGRLKSIGRKHATKGKTYDRVTGDWTPFDPQHLFEHFADVREMFLWGADYYAERIPQRGDGSWLVWDKRKPSQSEAIGSEFELCWSKAHHKRRVLRHDWFGFLSSENGAEAHHRVHPTQKPSSLMRDILEQWGKLQEIVVDLYLGSGTTLIAAEQLARACRAIEIEPQYVQVALDRWEQFTGEKAQKVGEVVRPQQVTRHKVTRETKKAQEPPARRRRENARARQ
jgi:DNA modification methylase